MAKLRLMTWNVLYKENADKILELIKKNKARHSLLPRNNHQLSY